MLIYKFFAEVHIFEKMPFFVPKHSYSNVGTQVKLSTRQVFSIETLCNYTRDAAVKIKFGFGRFSIVFAFFKK